MLQARRTAAIRTKLTDVQNWLSQKHLNPTIKTSILRFYAEDWGQLQEEDASILGVQAPQTLYVCIGQHALCCCLYHSIAVFGAPRSAPPRPPPAAVLRAWRDLWWPATRVLTGNSWVLPAGLVGPFTTASRANEHSHTSNRTLQASGRGRSAAVDLSLARRLCADCAYPAATIAV